MFVHLTMTENSNADMARLVTTGDVADFISMDGTDAHTETYRGAFFKKLGLTGAMKVGVIGLIKQPDFEAVIDSVKVMVPAANAGDPPTERNLAVAELGIGYCMGRVA